MEKSGNHIMFNVTHSMFETPLKIFKMSSDISGHLQINTGHCVFLENPSNPRVKICD